MIGAIIGDIAGIQYERNPVKGSFKVMENVNSFSDDTILTMAITSFCQNLKIYLN